MAILFPRDFCNTAAGCGDACSFSQKCGCSAPFNSLEFPTDIVLLAVVWRLHYKLSLRDVAEMFLERGFTFTDEAIRDWETRFAPLLADQLRTRATRPSRKVLVH